MEEKKLNELSDEALVQVAGGDGTGDYPRSITIEYIVIRNKSDLDTLCSFLDAEKHMHGREFVVMMLSRFEPPWMASVYESHGSPRLAKRLDEYLRNG